MEFRDRVGLPSWHIPRIWHDDGHSHGKLPDEPTSLSIHVGVDSHDFQPWHFHEIRRVMETKQRARELRDGGTKGDREQP
jgi:hypothetical protein